MYLAFLVGITIYPPRGLLSQLITPPYAYYYLERNVLVR